MQAVATGAGRNGTVESVGDAEKPLSLKLSSPKTLGGPGDGQNPEQLFAMGYACASPPPLSCVSRFSSILCSGSTVLAFASYFSKQPCNYHVI